MSRTTGPPVPRRVGVAEAKAHLSELLRDVTLGPIVVHNRGKDVAVIVAPDAFRQGDASPRGGERFLRRVAALLQEHGDLTLEPERLSFVPRDPFEDGPQEEPAKRAAPRRRRAR